MKQTGDDYFDSKEFQEMLDNYEESVKSGHPIFMDADDLADIADYYHFMNDPQQADEAKQEIRLTDAVKDKRSYG